MNDLIETVENLIKQRHENAILDSLISFVLYFFVIIGVVLLFIFVIKGIPWIISRTGTPIYELFSHENKEEEIVEIYHHIDKPLKKIEF